MHDQPTPDVSVTDVLYVAKTHLDVGFTASAAEVRLRYLDEFFPRAVDVAHTLRQRGGAARLRWTTGSWILSEALAAARGDQLDRLESAIEHGDLSWHAMPFTMHTELVDRSLLEHGLSMSAVLDRRFGRRTRAAKMTDVPGHTRSLVPVLAGAGIDFLHIGVNPAATAPEVPLQFRWLDDGSGESIQVMYQPASYGDVQLVAGSDVAVFVDLTGDNLGPPDAAMVTARFDALAARFPRAWVRAATLDDVADVVRAHREALPVVRSEIGDTWLHGTASDPPKVAAFRALSRLRSGWIRSGLVALDDPALSEASTRLLLVAEHTWGLDQKTHWPVESAWSESDLAAVRTDPSTVAFESSWAEQREYLSAFRDLLADGGRPDLAAQADRVLGDLGGVTAVRTSAARTSAVVRTAVEGRTFEVGQFRIGVGDDGSVVSLVDASGRDRASAQHRLGSFGERTFDAVDYERWYSSYNASTLPEDDWWARWDNTKPGLEHSGALSRWWRPTLVSAHVDHDELTIDMEVEREPGAPLALRPQVTMTVRALDANSIEFGLSWERAVARWPEATWWSFDPLVPEGGWQMLKLGGWVDPDDVVVGGAGLHGVERLQHTSGTAIDVLDAPLATTDPSKLLHWDPSSSRPPGAPTGWHFCVQANLWGTNFPMWTEGRCQARVIVELGS